MFIKLKAIQDVKKFTEPAPFWDFLVQLDHKQQICDPLLRGCAQEFLTELREQLGPFLDAAIKYACPNGRFHDVSRESTLFLNIWKRDNDDGVDDDLPDQAIDLKTVRGEDARRMLESRVNAMSCYKSRKPTFQSRLLDCIKHESGITSPGKVTAAQKAEFNSKLAFFLRIAKGSCDGVRSFGP